MGCPQNTNKEMTFRHCRRRPLESYCTKVLLQIRPLTTRKDGPLTIFNPYNEGQQRNEGFT